jgi:sialate O-acetylesterase
MIGSWRKAWNKDFPFYFVQVAPYAYGDEHIAALLRTAQTSVLSYPKTGMVITSDLVDNVNDIHPINKADIGLRLANYALADTYGKTDLAYKTPLYKSMSVEKNKIRISFENVITGLMTKGGDATEFYIAGDDQKFLPATVKIDRATVVVWNKAIKNPVAVRFGFSNTAMPNLYSKEGLPVNLFRTDNWTVSTAPVKK